MTNVDEVLEKRVPVVAVMRKSLRRQLELLAVNADMTMRSFIMAALKDKGLDVRDEDLEDGRITRWER